MAERRQRGPESSAVDGGNVEVKESTIVDQDKVTLIIVNGFMASRLADIPSSNYFWWKGWRHVEVFKYNNRDGSIEGHGSALADFVSKLAKARPEHTFYFYCTSMGNLVLRSAFQSPDMPESAKRGKHVSIAPPWRGAEWGRFVHPWAIARWISGEGTGKQLRTTGLDGFDWMGHHPATVTTLVISGTASYNPFISYPNDGTVTLQETFLQTPHYRYNIAWGIHPLFNFTPTCFMLAHSFFMGETSELELHPGLAAEKKDDTAPKAESSNAK